MWKIIPNHKSCQSTKKHTFCVSFSFFNCPGNNITASWIKSHRPKCSALTTIINIRFIFILGISTGNSNKRWKIAGSLDEALDAVKKHEIGETIRFSSYSFTIDFGVTSKKRFGFVM